MPQRVRVDAVEGEGRHVRWSGRAEALVQAVDVKVDGPGLVFTFY